MGVLTLQLLVCGQLLLYSLAAENKTDQIIQSTSMTTNTSQITPPGTAESLNTTGNYTENNVSTPSSHLINGSSTTSATPMTPTRPQNTTSDPKQTNVTVSGSTVKPNETTTQIYNTTKTSTSSPTTTVNVSTTAITSRNNTPYSSTTVLTTLTTPLVTKPTEKTSTTVTQNNSTAINKSSVGLSSSEKSLTVLFSALLGLIVLIVLVYFMHKYRKRNQTRVQYTHRRLQSDDTGEQYAGADDTLVISGGLYDGPQIYNPTMTVQNEEEFQADASGFGYASSQFRLEFLKEEQQRDPDRDASTFHSFNANDQEP
ncbi:sialomucin core protein 24-like [Triplophysa dalaica]|uniref:sialomucin core protein 24-like n=1 Tax=Triplophysa dalaica TaxID=1582913 RepID=UPI0024DF8861|nr:sialomucin core protein 24-like [Triplophysa dalaica]